MAENRWIVDKTARCVRQICAATAQAAKKQAQRSTGTQNPRLYKTMQDAVDALRSLKR